MAKIDMPLSYSAEASKLNTILFDHNRTTNGNVSWTSSTSGITYNTSTSSDPTILNCGDVGLANLLKSMYGGVDGWLLMAIDINNKSDSDHVHGSISNDGKVGSNANNALYTGNDGTVTAGTLPVAAGGTGKTTHTNGALLKGSGTSEVSGIVGVGAVYAETNGEPQFGTLPPSLGGTGQTSLALLRNSMGLGNSTGTLAVANGGTGVGTLQDLRDAMGLGSTTGTLPVLNGGTGVSSMQDLRNALGLGNTTGAIPVASGGTGETTLAAAREAMGLGNTTGALPITNGGTGAINKKSAKNNLGITYGTAEPTGGADGDIYLQYS